MESVVACAKDVMLVGYVDVTVAFELA